jgi:hypothetical protein
MSRTARWIFLVATFALLAVGPARAADVRFGPELSYGRGGNADARFGIGGRAVVDLATVRRSLSAVGSFGYFRPEGAAEGFGLKIGVSYWELNANLTHSFETSRRPPAKGARRTRKSGGMRIVPYVGAGLNLAHRGSTIEGAATTSSSQASLAVNLLAGAKLGRHLFAELRYEVGGGHQALVTAGFLFGGSGRRRVSSPRRVSRCGTPSLTATS